MFNEDETVLVSAIEHYSYCPRQCALIHVEQVFEENVFTVRGHLAHERVDEGAETVEEGVRTLRSVPLWSLLHGLRGVADLIELRPEGPFPVEYKSGRRMGRHADLQLCAQALCLEEMFGVSVPRAALFYNKTRRRIEVPLDEATRARTLSVISSIRAMLRSAELPGAPNDARCRNCSLIDVCLPNVIGEPARLRGLQGALFHPWEMGQIADYEESDKTMRREEDA